MTIIIVLVHCAVTVLLCVLYAGCHIIDTKRTNAINHYCLAANTKQTT